MRRELLVQVLALGSSVYLLLWISIFNGYPIVFPDTGSYLVGSVTLQPAIMRPIVYSLFIRLVSFGITSWLVVLAQSLITIFILYTVYEYLFRDNAPPKRQNLLFLVLILFLVFSTSLPWYVGQLMPDVFTGLTFLSVFLLLYYSELSLEKTILVSFVLSVSVGSHLSHVVSLTLFLGAILILRVFGAARQFWPRRSTTAIIGFVLVPILASTGIVALANWHAGMGFTLSPGGQVFLLGRLIESGLAEDYLEQQCTTEQLTACKYLHNLPRTSEEFEFGPHPLLNEMGGWLGSKAEAKQIVFGTIRRRPLRFAVECGKQMLWQFVSIKPFFQRHPFENKWELSALQQFFPDEIPRFQAAQQWTGSLQKVRRTVTPICIFVFWASMALSLILFIRRPARSGDANQLFILTVVFLFSNALTTGALSEVSNRYQSRASWLMAFCTATYIIQHYSRERTNRPAL